MLTAACLLGCGIVGSAGERSLGILVISDGGEPRVSVPDTVAAGEEFSVTVQTHGLDGCWRKGETEVEVDRSRMRASVTPYDVDARSEGVACTAAIQEFTHTAVLRFDEAGTASVRVRGRSLPADGEIDVERAVTVR